MDLDERIEQVLDAELNDSARILAAILIDNRYINNPERYDEDEYLQILRDFLDCARNQFVIGLSNYLEERVAVENVFQTVMRAHRFPEELLPEATKTAVMAYFEWWIDYHIDVFKEQTGKDSLPPPDNDVSVIDMACIFGHIWPSTDDEAFCESIGVQYHYEQLHMVLWFSGQITKGIGQYSRSKANLSSRTTYNRLLNANSLLWIGTILGINRDTLRRAAEAAGPHRTTAAACGKVRKYVSFDDLLPKTIKLYDELIGQYELQDGRIDEPSEKETPERLDSVYMRLC